MLGGVPDPSTRSTELVVTKTQLSLGFAQTHDN